MRLALLTFLLLLAPAFSQGEIDRIIHSGTVPLKTGDALHVIMTGTPGGLAHFEILGKTSKQSMAETSAGRYEASMPIPKGLEVKDGIVLVTLTVGGRETMLEASRLLTVEAAGGASPGRRPALVSPGPTTGSSRPSVEVAFPNQILPRSATFFVDGLNFTSQASVTPTSLRWTPRFDMDNGPHKVEVRATGQQGEAFSESFTFTTIPGTASPPPQVGTNPRSSARLSVTNMRNGAVLGSAFTVEGRGIPGSTVVVTVEHPKNDIVSLLIGRMLRFQSRGMVGNNGQFSIQLDAGAVRQGDPMTITVSDTANSPSVTISGQKGAPDQTLANLPPPPSVPTSRPFFDNQNNFGLSIPAGWSQVSDPSFALKLTKSSATDFAVAVRPTSDLKTTVDLVRAALIGDGARITSEQPVTLSQVPGTGMEFQTRGGGDGFAVVCVNSRSTYLLIAESKAPTDLATRRDMETMLTSFRIR